MGVFLCPVSDLFLMEDEVALLQSFGDEGLVFSGGVAREGVEIIVREEAIRSAIKTSVASSWHFISTY